MLKRGNGGSEGSPVILLDDESDSEDEGNYTPVNNNISRGGVTMMVDSSTSSSSTFSRLQEERRRRRMQHMQGGFVAPAVEANAQGVIDLLEDEPEHSSAISRSNRKRPRQNFNATSTSTSSSGRVWNVDDTVIDLEEDQSSSTRAVLVNESRPSWTRTPMYQLEEVFPDVCPKYAEAQLIKWGMRPERVHGTDNDSSNNRSNNTIPIDESSIVQRVLANLADSSYPKRPPPACTSANSNTTAKRHKPSHDYLSRTSFVPSPSYMSEANVRLMADFPFLSKSGVKKLLKEASQHYAIAHETICHALMGREANGSTATTKSSSIEETERKEEQDYHRLMDALTGKVLTREQIARLCRPLGSQTRTTLARPRSTGTDVVVTDPILVDEIGFVKRRNGEWMEMVQLRLERKEARERSERTGTTLECQCCYGDVAFEEMVACRDEGHLFCVTCVRRYAEERIFGLGSLPSAELTCFHGDGCTSAFSNHTLERALPPKVMTKYNEMQFRSSIEKAHIDEMCQCPKCEFQCILPETQMILNCPECGVDSCRKCGEEPHIPLKCSEVEKKTETDGRKVVEEAMTAAKVRICPKCKKGFFKSDGCNKITCACGTFICYVCRQPIPPKVGYAHFCQTAHCQHQSCHKCPLYSNAEEDDKRAMREAGMKAVAQVQSHNVASTSSSSSSTSTSAPIQVRVDVDALLQVPSPRRAVPLGVARRH